MGSRLGEFIIVGAVLLVKTAECHLLDVVDTNKLGSEISESSQINRNPIFDFLYGPGLSVQEIVDLESKTWHWYPYKRIEYDVLNESVYSERTCEKDDSIDELPQDIFTQEQRRNGALILHLIGVIYFFTVLAVVCDNYFLPSVECICEDLDISEDVAAATFMSVASNAPEMFTNMIGTFITNSSDMGLGTIIGSMMFNTLGVAASASLATATPVQLDWFPLTRDSIIFSINLSILTAMAWDGQIMWYETSILFALFIVYFVILFKNHKYERALRNFIEDRFSLCRPVEKDVETCDIKTVLGMPKETHEKHLANELASNNLDVQVNTESAFRMPKTGGLRKFWWLYTWPIKYVLLALVPNPKHNRKLYPLSFILCIVLIGVNSYLIYWMVAIIGQTLEIPESVMGLTLLACGGCLPEAIACVILIRRGEGSFGVSNSLGANSLAILMSLGVPWFVRTMVDGAASTGAYIKISSYGISFTITSLLLAVLALYVVLSFSRHRLQRSVGVALFFFYTIFISLAILMELDILFPSGNICS